MVYIQQSPELGLLMARNSLGPLDDVQGRLYVKQSSPGTSIKTDGGEAVASPGSVVR